jgi:hypothetical protein
MCIYLGRHHVALDGQKMWLSDDPDEAFRYSEKERGAWRWVYDPVMRQMFSPAL